MISKKKSTEMLDYICKELENLRLQMTFLNNRLGIIDNRLNKIEKELEKNRDYIELAAGNYIRILNERYADIMKKISEK